MGRRIKNRSKTIGSALQHNKHLTMNHTADSSDYTNSRIPFVADIILFIMILFINLCFGLVAEVAFTAYRNVRLHLHGKESVGVVQLSRIGIMDNGYYQEPLYILEVVFLVQNSQGALNMTVEYAAANKDGITIDSDKKSAPKYPMD